MANQLKNQPELTEFQSGDSLQNRESVQGLFQRIGDVQRQNRNTFIDEQVGLIKCRLAPNTPLWGFPVMDPASLFSELRPNVIGIGDQTTPHFNPCVLHRGVAIIDSWLLRIWLDLRLRGAQIEPRCTEALTDSRLTTKWAS